jgi:hypothetical protein
VSISTSVDEKTMEQIDALAARSGLTRGGCTHRSSVRICLLRQNHHENKPAGKSHAPGHCPECNKTARDFRYWILNSESNELPPGWVGQIHNLTTETECGGGRGVAITFILLALQHY